MKIAILGAGLAGLSVGWHLLHESSGSVAVDLFDPQPIGEGTSGIASGLLHTMTANRAKLSWQAELCLKKTHRLITAAGAYSNKPPVITKGLLHLALHSKQVEDFQIAAQQIPDCIWLEKEHLEQSIPYMTPPYGGLLIQSALTLDMPCYLEGLLQAILRLGGNWHQKKVTDPALFEQYDKVIIAMGAETLSFNILRQLPLSLVKGQLLELKWPPYLDPPTVAIMSHMHLVMRRDLRTFILGASFEREFSDGKKDEEKAKKLLLSKLSSLFPPLADAEVIRCESGLRVCPTSHLPLIGRIDEKFWFYTGLCSKGLLFHGLLGEALAQAVLQDNPSLVPPETFISLKTTTVDDKGT